ncbi:hypothetical protein LINPERHAP1_LOCUS20483, partial [Linum perenne]
SYIGALEGPKSLTPSFKQSWIPVGEHDITPQITNGLRSLSLSKEFKDKLCKPWVNTLVVRLLGKSIGYSYLCHRLRSMWKPANPIHIIDLDKGCFMVKFGDEHDYFKALTGGPWMILDHYLVVHQWTPDFRVSDSLTAKMVVWVRFPLMPVQYYHAQILTLLGNLLGRTVKIDYNTQHAERGKFARLAVEIDLNEPLAPMIKLDGCWQDVEYENLPALCFTCGKVGHLLAECPSSSPTVGPATQELPQPALPSPEMGIRPALPSPDSFGPWMVVTRKSRRPRKESEMEKESAILRKEVTQSSVIGKGKKDDPIKSTGAGKGKKSDPPRITGDGKGKRKKPLANDTTSPSSVNKGKSSHASSDSNIEQVGLTSPAQAGPTDASLRGSESSLVINGAPSKAQYLQAQPSPQGLLKTPSQSPSCPPEPSKNPSTQFPNPSTPTAPNPSSDILFPLPPPTSSSSISQPPSLSQRFQKNCVASPKQTPYNLNSKGAVGLKSSLKPALSSLKKRDFKKVDATKILIHESSLARPSSSTNIDAEATVVEPSVNSILPSGAAASSLGGWDLNSPTPT